VDALDTLLGHRFRVGGGHSEADCEFVTALVRAWLVELTCNEALRSAE